MFSLSCLKRDWPKVSCISVPKDAFVPLDSIPESQHPIKCCVSHVSSIIVFIISIINSDKSMTGVKVGLVEPRWWTSMGNKKGKTALEALKYIIFLQLMNILYLSLHFMSYSWFVFLPLAITIELMIIFCPKALDILIITVSLYCYIFSSNYLFV